MGVDGKEKLGCDDFTAGSSETTKCRTVDVQNQLADGLMQESTASTSPDATSCVSSVDTSVVAAELDQKDRLIEQLSAELEHERAELLAARTALAEARDELSWRIGESRRGQKYRVLIHRYHEFFGGRGMRLLLRVFGWRPELTQWEKMITREGLFDAKWYEKCNPDVVKSRINPLLHYLLWGAFEGRKPNPYFDSAWYLETYSDVREKGINPLIHYILFGVKEKRDCGPEFSTEAYLKANPDVAESGANPLGHYLKYGLKEGRKTTYRNLYRPTPPAWSVFEELAKERSLTGQVPTRDFVVDVIIPVYRGYDDTLSCIYSVLKSRNKTPFDLVVIDDFSPERAVSQALDRLCELGLISLFRNQQNLGFVCTVNRGMRLHPKRDVVLLNSDTEVYGDWLDRLLAHGRDKRVGTVTPFSNNATICSYPVFDTDNAEPLEVEYSTLDRLCADTNPGASVSVPTAIGFCVLISRAALNAVGYFDEESFGRGYGEENDFCMRLEAAGWRNLFALDVFVRHTGETSFAGDARELQRQGMRVLQERHPQYLDNVKRHVALNPAGRARRRLDCARIRKQVGKRTVLCITHNRGGGIERYLRDEAERLRAEGFGVVLLCPVGEDGLRGSMNILDSLHLPNLADLDPIHAEKEIAEVLVDLGVESIQLHSLADWSYEMVGVVPRLAQKHGVPYEFMIHDYIAVCPQVNLMHSSGYYCGERGIEQCRACVGRKGAKLAKVHPDNRDPKQGIDVVQWRRDYGQLMAKAERLIAPSVDAANRMMRYFPGLKVLAEYHEDRLQGPAETVALPYKGGSLRIVTIGAIGTYKGSRVLLECAKDSLARKLPLEFVVVGCTNLRELNTLANVVVTGRYSEDDVFDILREQACHLAFFPSVWPETYCYTLTIAVEGGFPCVVFDFGAPAERLRLLQGGVFLPLEMMGDASGINDVLLDYKRRASRADSVS